MTRAPCFLSAAALLLVVACGSGTATGVTPPGGDSVVASVTVTPQSPSVAIGTTLQLTATPQGANGAALAGHTITWNSSATNVATVSGSGLVTAVSAGSSTITATSEGKSGQTTVTVSVVLAPVASVTLSTIAGPLVRAQTATTTATLTDGQGNLLSGRAVSWQSAASSVATVDQNGTVTAVSPGTATIIATSEGKSGQTSVTVMDGGIMTTVGGTVSSASGDVSITFPSGALGATTPISIATAASLPGATGLIAGTGYDFGPSGTTFAQPVMLNIRYSDAQAAGHTAAQFRIHRLTAGAWVLLASGSVNTATHIVSAPTSSFSTYAILDITAPVATVEVTAGTPTLAVDETTPLTVHLKDGSGNELTGRTVTYGSSNNLIATVSALGVVTAVAPGGPVTITATSEGKSGTTTVSVTPPFVLASITGDFDHTCGLTPAGKAYCWGKNTYGEIGDGTTTLRSVPTPVSGNMTFIALSAGGTHTCGLTTDGAAWCWGYNEFHTLNDGTSTNRTTPVAVLGGKVFTRISAGDAHTCALTAPGAAWCWGFGSDGRLGGGSIAFITYMNEVAGNHLFTSIAAGPNHSCAIDTLGQPWCWGLNLDGEIGDGTTATAYGPVAAGVIALVEITIGERHTCGITAPGNVWCWGDNGLNQSGNGSIIQQQRSPVPVLAGFAFANISAGEAHTCGRTAQGAILCWGRNNWGQMGDGSATGLIQRGNPLPVSGGLIFVSLTSGWNHACGLTALGEAWCWGQNAGALGDGTTTVRSVPVRVKPPWSY